MFDYSAALVLLSYLYSVTIPSLIRWSSNNFILGFVPIKVNRGLSHNNSMSFNNRVL